MYILQKKAFREEAGTVKRLLYTSDVFVLCMSFLFLNYVMFLIPDSAYMNSASISVPFCVCFFLVFVMNCRPKNHWPVDGWLEASNSH